MIYNTKIKTLFETRETIRELKFRIKRLERAGYRLDIIEDQYAIVHIEKHRAELMKPIDERNKENYVAATID